VTSLAGGYREQILILAMNFLKGKSSNAILKPEDVKEGYNKFVPTSHHD
jgi:hypothetical protein